MSPTWIAAILSLSIGSALTAIIAYLWHQRATTSHRQHARDAERRAALAEHLAELGTMTGGLAHEIKNPLSTIGLNAELLSEDINDLPNVSPDEKRRLTNRIGTLYREIDRLRGILDDFLQFAGRMHLDPSTQDLNLLITELVDFFQPQAERAGVRLHAQLPTQPIHAQVDSHLFKQALLNLLINAVQAFEATPPSDTQPRELMLRLENNHPPETSNQEQPQPENNNHNQIVLHITDTGPGISKEAIAKIFQPYFSTKKGGTGLGLPTTRRIIDAHGGHLEVHSEPNRGTDFIIYLPSA